MARQLGVTGVLSAIGDEFEILRQIFRTGLNEAQGLPSKGPLLTVGRGSQLTELIPDFIEASQVSDADLSHEFDLELLAISAQFSSLDVPLLFELLLVSDGVLEVVQLISRRLDVLHVRDLPEQALIVKLLQLIIISDVGLSLHDTTKLRFGIDIRSGASHGHLFLARYRLSSNLIHNLIGSERSRGCLNWFLNKRILFMEGFDRKRILIRLIIGVCSHARFEFELSDHVISCKLVLR